jgi:hypothetical protein
LWWPFPIVFVVFHRAYCSSNSATFHLIPHQAVLDRSKMAESLATDRENVKTSSTSFVLALPYYADFILWCLTRVADRKDRLARSQTATLLNFKNKLRVPVTTMLQISRNRSDFARCRRPPWSLASSFLQPCYRKPQLAGTLG